MNSTAAIQIGALLASGLMLAGCSGETAPSASTTPSTAPEATTSASSPATPSPTSTLTAEEQQAFEEATEVVLAYRQTITDLYSGARTNLNDLNAVATGDKVDQDLVDVQRNLGDGWRYEPKGGQVLLVSAEPVEVVLTSEPEEVIVRACVDTSGIADISPTGERTLGIREELDYTLVRTDYLPAPGWAVTRVTTDVDEPADRRC